MTKFEKVMLGAMVILIIAVVGLALSLKNNGSLKLGSVQTVASYATADTVTNHGGLYLWDTESTSGLEVKGPTHLAALSTTGDLTSTGDTRTASLVVTGAIATFTTTSAATAANVCDNTLWTITPAVSAATITLPATTTLFADCMTTNGDVKMVNILNGSGTTSTVIAAGTGGTLLYSSSTTIAAGKGALLRVVRNSATTYTAGLVNLAN